MRRTDVDMACYSVAFALCRGASYRGLERGVLTKS